MAISSDDLVNLASVDEDDLRRYLRNEVPQDTMESFFGKYADEMNHFVNRNPKDTKKGDSIIILLPGLTGSLLEDVGSDAEVIWINPLAFLKGHVNHLDLDDSGMKDATPGVRIEATRPIWIIYAKMMLALQEEYEVYSFPFDWRRSTADSARRLMAFIDEKTAASPRKQVTLVGHSMGGVVIASYLCGDKTQAHAAKKVKRAITLGTPFRGALQVVFTLARGNDPKMLIADKLNKANNAVRMLRTCPGMYELLPAPNGLYSDWEPLPKLDIWNADTWIKAGYPINPRHLAAGLAHHQALAAADPQMPIYNVIGTYEPTPVKLTDALFTAIPKYFRDGLMGGDGTVAVYSAQFKTSPAYYVQEVHVELVLEQTVIEAIEAWVDGGQPTSLVRDVSQVVQNDLPLRAASPLAPMSLRTDTIAKKVSAAETLTSEDVRTLFVSMSEWS